MFDDDAAAQLLVIGNNLAGCRQTRDPERSILRTTIDGEVADPAELGHILRVQQAVRIRVLQEKWYFLGQQRPELNSKTLLSTQSEFSFEQICAEGLLSIRPSLHVSEAHEIALRILSDLGDPLLFELTREDNGAVPLHRHGTPMWLADPDSASDFAAIGLLPARLGLAPRSGPYILLFPKATNCHVPRFSDSGGYPYWRPGGRTCPLEQCPPGCDGFIEVVADRLTIAALLKAPGRFSRTV